MADKVVDASALGALLFNEPEDEMVVAKLRGARLHAPTLLTYELANICWKKIRRGEGAEQILEKLAVLDSLDIQYHDVPAVAAAALALSTGLTGYDASYLWLARELGAVLVTLDAKLQAASALL
jgi:predicted nucleic acid-binding protein